MMMMMKKEKMKIINEIGGGGGGDWRRWDSISVSEGRKEGRKKRKTGTHQLTILVSLFHRRRLLVESEDVHLKFVGRGCGSSGEDSKCCHHRRSSPVRLRHYRTANAEKIVERQTHTHTAASSSSCFTFLPRSFVGS